MKQIKYLLSIFLLMLSIIPVLNAQTLSGDGIASTSLTPSAETSLEPNCPIGQDKCGDGTCCDVENGLSCYTTQDGINTCSTIYCEEGGTICNTGTGEECCEPGQFCSPIGGCTDGCETGLTECRNGYYLTCCDESRTCNGGFCDLICAQGEIPCVDRCCDTVSEYCIADFVKGECVKKVCELPSFRCGEHCCNSDEECNDTTLECQKKCNSTPEECHKNGICVEGEYRCGSYGAETCCPNEMGCDKYSGQCIDTPKCKAADGESPCGDIDEEICCKYGERCNIDRTDKPSCVAQCETGEVKCGKECCPEGSSCSGDGGCCAPGSQTCGNGCCDSNHRCNDGQCIPECSQGTFDCGNNCCTMGENCRVRRKSKPAVDEYICVPSCKDDQFECGSEGEGGCCNQDEECVSLQTTDNGELGSACIAKCPDGQFGCGLGKDRACCREGVEDCSPLGATPGGQCVPKTGCYDKSKYKCGNIAGQDVCCDSEEECVVRNGRYECDKTPPPSPSPSESYTTTSIDMSGPTGEEANSSGTPVRCQDGENLCGVDCCKQDQYCIYKNGEYTCDKEPSSPESLPVENEERSSETALDQQEGNSWYQFWYWW